MSQRVEDSPARAEAAPAREALGALWRSRLVRALRAHEHRTAAGLFALLVLAYLWPALLTGRMLSPLALLHAFAPFSHVAPPGIDPYVNPALTDVAISYYPWQVLARELLHAGTFPAWNPYAFGGTPFFANFELAWLSPFSLPLWIFPLHYALGLAAALKLWVAGFGTYLLVRELKLGFLPALVAGIGFTLCAFNVIWLSHGVHVSVAVLLPWTLWLVERIVQRGRAVDGLALAGVVALALAGGHPGTQLHLLSGGVLYGLVRMASTGGLARRERLRRLGLVGAAMALGGLVMAVVLLPAQQAAIDTTGAVARQDGESFHGTLPFGALRTALFPDWWGRPMRTLVGPADYNERTFYAGGAILVLAVVGLVSAGRWRLKAAFGLLAVLGVAIPLRAPGLYDLVVNLPLFDRVQNQRILLWFLLAVAVLAAVGLQAVLEAPKLPRRVWAVLAAALLAVPLAVAFQTLDGDTLDGARRYFLHRTGSVEGSAPALASVGWWLVFVVALAACLAIVWRRPQRRWLAGGLVALVVALDMLHFAHGYQPMGPASTIVPTPPPSVAYLQRHAGDHRIAGLGDTLMNDYTTVYGLRDARGYDAPQPSFRFFRLWRVMSPDQHSAGFYSPRNVDLTTLRVLGLLGVRHVIGPPTTNIAGAGTRVVYRKRDATIFTNPFAMPRAMVAARVHVARSEREELAAVRHPAFDPRRDAVVRADELGDARLGAAGAGRARVVDEENARVTLHASLKRPGLVVLDDAWAPGWSVEVDGRPARALQTDVVLRGVAVPAGEHEIVWSFRVPGLRLGAALSLLGLLVMAAWGGLLFVRRGRCR